MKTQLLKWIALFPIIFFLSCGEKSHVKTLKLAHTLDVNHSVHIAMIKMADVLEEKSGGKLLLEIYPNQQLGSERECLELLQIGSLDITKVSASVMENFAPKLKVLSLPYIFRDKAHHYKVLDSKLGKALLLEGEKYWLRGLCYYDAGSRSFYTKTKPIHAPADLEGLKIRVMNSPTAISMVRAFGGAATPISWGELYTALQQGVVDGAENNPPSFYLSRHYEVCKYYSLNEHSFVPDMLLMSSHTWKKLNEKEQQWLNEAVEASVKYQRELWQTSEKESLEAVKKAGVEVIYPSKRDFILRAKVLHQSFIDDHDIFQLIQEIQNL